MRKSSASKVSRKALSVLMSVVLVVGLMPLPAYADLAPGSSDDLVAGGIADSDDAGAQAGSDASLSAQEEGNFDKIGDQDYYADEYFRYYYEITGVSDKGHPGEGRQAHRYS